MRWVAALIVIAASAPLPLDGWYNCAYYTFSQRRRLADANAAAHPRGFHSMRGSPWASSYHVTKHAAIGSTQRSATASAASTSTPSAQCATFAVPLCHPGVCTSSKTIDVFVKRIPAAGSATSVWLVQGGPGASSVAMEGFMLDWFIRMNGKVSVYTIDHRGTGRSEWLGCDATQAETAGSDGGAPVTVSELPDCLRSMQRRYDYQPAAFSITSAANDVAAVISSLGETSAYVYGVSYGTAVVSRVMHFSPSVVRGFILDGVQSEAFPTWIDAPTFTNWDRDFSDVADRFLDLCHDDAFCRSKFSTLRGTLQVLYADLDSGKHNCTAFVKSLGNDDIAPSNILRALFGSFFPDMAMRLLVPVFIYRLRRCTANDMDVMTFALIRVYGDSEGGGGGDPPDVDAPDSSMLYKTIVFSELWQRPSPGLMDLYQVFANSTMSSGIYSQVLEYCLFAGVVAAEQSCVDLGTMLPTTASATNFTYTPDTYFNVTATIPPHTSVLVLSGKLDPQTPHKYAEDQFQRMAGTAKRMFAFEYAAHGTIATTPVITPNHPTCAVSLILSYVQNQGDLDAIDTSCVARVQPLVFEWTSTAAKDAFNVTDAYDGIVGEDAPRPKPTTAAPTERPDNTQTSYLTGVVVACALLGVLSITLVVLLRMLHQLARRDTVSNIAVQA
ncbi:hypothetical protein H310_14111 [Aphanomyces invadans]|uniref:AB hydrolase-1 domain-containing protein n=1 Tax=Aphanomyces invadans TaxID=157072 RepID=A0A024TD21_9STRA|nr:hypothetical protein H310_14111 [Aphanomyces invadans]ETV91257.1 hypothetical protein H310_14111 [Aphanomyces invadans]|eukprot:XP_008880094.1 hypothetical protein H310_14111 [Aphanomyces invadans]